jgi:hypothetical protein
MALSDPIGVVVVGSAILVILLVGAAWYLYRHGKRVGRLEARAAPKT